MENLLQVYGFQHEKDVVPSKTKLLLWLKKSFFNFVYLCEGVVIVLGIRFRQPIGAPK